MKWKVHTVSILWYFIMLYDKNHISIRIICLVGASAAKVALIYCCHKDVTVNPYVLQDISPLSSSKSPVRASKPSVTDGPTDTAGYRVACKRLDRLSPSSCPLNSTKALHHSVVLSREKVIAIVTIFLPLSLGLSVLRLPLYLVFLLLSLFLHHHHHHRRRRHRHRHRT